MDKQASHQDLDTLEVKQSDRLRFYEENKRQNKKKINKICEECAQKTIEVFLVDMLLH
ncbi:hypothetical protein Bhyg_15951, partial [Pseudolycoriella hygida]